MLVIVLIHEEKVLGKHRGYRFISFDLSCFSPSGYVIVHCVHFLFALLFVYVFVLPIQRGQALIMLKNLGIILYGGISLILSLVE